MKTSIYLLAMLFVMNFTLLSAGNPKIIILRVNVKTDNIALNKTELAPVTPKEATFEDINSESNIQTINLLILQKIIPVTPKEAEFEDTANEKIIEIDPLAPCSPVAAAFEQ
jgi:hypothetical protein